MDNNREYNVDWTKELNQAAYDDLFNLYNGLVKAGFSRPEAMLFITEMFKAVIMKGGK